MKTEPSQKSLKSRMRKELRSRRSGIPLERRKTWDAAINRHLAEYIRRAECRTVSAYMAFDGEPDLMPTLKSLATNGVKLALPVVQDAPGKAIITFRQWPVDGKLQKNRYGISEPAGTPEIHFTDIDLILVPLVGWDRAGARLGMGASFYDRLFQPFAALAKPVRMGVAYALQEIEHIPSEPWDIGMHSILTENGCFACPG
jgi:5-formyltetrahydrofolate cyclo-ligase